MKTQKQNKRSRVKAATHSFGKAVRHYYPKVLSGFLSLLLVYQCFMTDGVSYALAEAMYSNNDVNAAASNNSSDDSSDNDLISGESSSESSETQNQSGETGSGTETDVSGNTDQNTNQNTDQNGETNTRGCGRKVGHACSAKGVCRYVYTRREKSCL